jgi:nitroreductase
MSEIDVLPSQTVLTECVRTATAAPSLHNSQPWRFRIGAGTVEVYADPSRRLPVLDPTGREQLVSVGAALFTLRLAVRRAGFHTEFALFPDEEEADLVARVSATGPSEPTPAVEALAAAIPHRHTNRWPFARSAVPADVLEHLKDAARREGAVLTVASSVSRDAILGLSESADILLHEQPGYGAELARWAGGGPGRADGVPVSAIGPWDALETIPVRDFAAILHLPRPSEQFEPYPTVLVLSTRGDGPAEQVGAGQALQRVLLTATWQNLATTPISQPVEIPIIREKLVGDGLSAQMVLRVGYGRPVGATPRRPVDEVLLADRGRS